MTTDMVYELLVRIQDDTADMRRRLGGVEQGQAGLRENFETLHDQLHALREEFEVFRDETVSHFARLETTMAEQFTLLLDGQQKVYGLVRASQADRRDIRRRLRRIEADRE